MRIETEIKTSLDIFVVDDDQTSQNLLLHACSAAGFRIKSFLNGDSFLASGDLERAACVILDVDTTDQSGKKIWNKIDARVFPAPILITSERHEVISVVNAIKRGAFDFVVKPFKAENVIGCIRSAIKSFRWQYANCEPLTPRERQVLSRIASGFMNKEMGRDLGVSYRTIECHRTHIMRKMHARNAADLVRIAMSNDFRI